MWEETSLGTTFLGKIKEIDIIYTQQTINNLIFAAKKVSVIYKI